MGLTSVGAHAAGLGTIEPGTADALLNFVTAQPAATGVDAQLVSKPIVLAAAQTTTRAPRRTMREGAIVGAPPPQSAATETEMAPPRRASSSDESPYSDILALSNKFVNPKAPPWLFVPKLALKEIATDNVFHTATDKKADLISELQAGLTVSADTPRLRGLFTYTAGIRRAIRDTDENRIPQYGFLTAHATIVPDLLFLDLHGIAHELERQGGGVVDTSLLSNTESTQAYALSASPDFKSRLGDFAVTDLRYVYSQAWFVRNTGPNFTPGFVLAPLGNSTQQEAHGDIKMAGTIADKLLSDLSVDGTYNETGKLPGIYRKGTVESINEYQLTRSISAVGAFGYQALSDRAFAGLNGQEPIWDVGARWKPNADSYILVLYGRQDLKTDISGEMQWRFTPTSSLYAAYTDSISNTQQSLVGNNEDSLLGEDGPAVGVTYSESPVIATLNSRDFGLDAQPQAINIGAGLPLQEVDNFIRAENGIFRRKLARGIFYTNIAGQAFSLTVLHAERIALAGATQNDLLTRKIIFAWMPAITENLVGRAAVGYSDQDQSGGKSYNMSLGLRYAYSDTFEASVLFNHVHHMVDGSTGSYVVNAMTIRARKLF